MTYPYHSARKPPEEVPEMPATFRRGRSLAFVRDLVRDGLAPEHQACDVFYTEMAWRPGYEEFKARAGVTDGDFNAYCAALSRAIEETTAPFYLITGKAIRPRLPPPTQTFESGLNGGGCVVHVYRDEYTGGRSTNRRILDSLARRFRYVGDPCCGYGNTGRVFALRGGDFVLSDFNPLCVAHIAAHAGEWR